MEAKIEHQDTVAYVLIKTELGAAPEVAAEVSRQNWKEEDEKGVMVKGVRWTATIMGPYDVVAAVRVRDNVALGDLVVNRIQTIPGIRNPLAVVVTQYFKDGEPIRTGHNGHP